MPYNKAMEAALLEPENNLDELELAEVSDVFDQVEKVPGTRDLNELLTLGTTADEIASIVRSRSFGQLGYEAQVKKIGDLLEKKRMDHHFDIPAFRGDVNEYRAWDKKYAKEIVGQRQMEATLPGAVSAEEKSQIEMEAIMPAKKTDVERYTNLIGLATAKAKEFEDKSELTKAEEKRLEEIKGDIILFSEKLEAARAAEERTPEMVRRELSEGFPALNKKGIATELPNQETAAVIDMTLPETPKRKWWQLRNKEPQITTPTTSQRSIFVTKNPPPKGPGLGPLNKINDGVRVP